MADKTALYRLSTREVVKISNKVGTKEPQSFPDMNPVYWGVLTDPTVGSGVPDVLVLDVDSKPSRVQGEAVHANVAGTEIRLASQAEIDTYSPGETEDAKQQDADGAENLAETNPRFRKVFKAMAKLMVDQLNVLRQEINTINGDTALSDITYPQAYTALKNGISKDD
jgi:hypothetical protein